MQVPTTWDEFLGGCQTFKDAGLIPLALGNQDPWASCHYISTFNGMCVPQDIREKDKAPNGRASGGAGGFCNTGSAHGKGGRGSRCGTGIRYGRINVTALPSDWA